MSGPDDLSTRFETARPRLLAVAGRLLGDPGEAQDVVQESWFRLRRADPGEIRNLDAWLTRTVSRLALDVLRSARYRHERPWQPVTWPEEPTGDDPASEVEQGDRAAEALLVVLDVLSPAERIALVLHDVFGAPFDEVAEAIGRTPAAARQLASRARRRVQDAPPPDRRRERRVLEAWLHAVRTGDLRALLALLDEDAVLTAEYGATGEVVRGATEIAGRAVLMGSLADASTLVRVSGRPAILAAPHSVPVSIMVFEISGDRIVRIEVMADPHRLRFG